MRLSEVSVTPMFHTKKPPMPTFSGDRSDWPEFKSVWHALAETQFTNKFQLAMLLKQVCHRGRAKDLLKNVCVTSDAAYNEMWQRLSEEYDDTGLCVQAAHQRLDAIKRVDEFDYEGMVKLVDAVEGVHNMLKELNMLDAIHMSHVDDLGLKLPRSIHHDWTR